LKTSGTNLRFDRSGLDGAERFSTKAMQRPMQP
jgi:hypothetical protein